MTNDETNRFAIDRAPSDLVEFGLASINLLRPSRACYRTRHWKWTAPPPFAGTGSVRSHFSTTEPASFGVAVNVAFMLDFSLPATYSKRVVRLSTIVTLPIFLIADVVVSGS